MRLVDVVESGTKPYHLEGQGQQCSTIVADIAGPCDTCSVCGDVIDEDSGLSRGVKTRTGVEKTESTQGGRDVGAVIPLFKSVSFVPVEGRRPL
ncbi:unnamed protein product [Taenia asiatica]|uniref:Transposase n=1 Tax=Taenia asiatica TaxID=60517 RepID=A0A0R3VVS3_TAEAS|nr:unnamed protein product [Taenia asiatica]